jgi:hypothetical protein
MSEAERWEQVTDDWQELAHSDDDIVRLDFRGRTSVAAARYFGFPECSEDVDIAIPEAVRSADGDERLTWLKSEAAGRYQEMVRIGSDDDMAAWQEAKSRLLDWYIGGLVELGLVTALDEELFGERYARNSLSFVRYIRFPDAMRSQPNSHE